MLWKLRVASFQFLKPAVEKVVSARFKRLKRSSGVGSLTSITVAPNSSSLDVVSTSTVPGLSSVASAIGVDTVGEKKFRINEVDRDVELTWDREDEFAI